MFALVIQDIVTKIGDFSAAYCAARCFLSIGYVASFRYSRSFELRAFRATEPISHTRKASLALYICSDLPDEKIVGFCSSILNGEGYNLAGAHF